jgi:hypothetical protein
MCLPKTQGFLYLWPLGFSMRPARVSDRPCSGGDLSLRLIGSQPSQDTTFIHKASHDSYIQQLLSLPVRVGGGGGGSQQRLLKFHSRKEQKGVIRWSSLKTSSFSAEPYNQPIKNANNKLYTTHLHTRKFIQTSFFLLLLLLLLLLLPCVITR